MKNVGYKMEFTRGHVERTSKMSHIIQEPFKKNYLSFESTKNHNMKKNLIKNKLKTQKMKHDTIQYESKKQLLEQYRQNFGIYLPPKEE